MHIPKSSIVTYYAGKRSTFKAVATIAHWAIDGYSSDMAASNAGFGAMGGKHRLAVLSMLASRARI